MRFSEYLLEDANLVVVVYGTPSRVALTAIKSVRAEGINAGLFRPRTLFPFPYQALSRLADRVRAILLVELSQGQLLEDVRLAVCERVPVRLHNRLGGMVPTHLEIATTLLDLGRR